MINSPALNGEFLELVEFTEQPDAGTEEEDAAITQSAAIYYSALLYLLYVEDQWSMFLQHCGYTPCISLLHSMVTAAVLSYYHLLLYVVVTRIILKKNGLHCGCYTIKSLMFFLMPALTPWKPDWLFTVYYTLENGHRGNRD